MISLIPACGTTRRKSVTGAVGLISIALCGVAYSINTSAQAVFENVGKAMRSTAASLIEGVTGKNAARARKEALEKTIQEIREAGKKEQQEIRAKLEKAAQERNEKIEKEEQERSEKAEKRRQARSEKIEKEEQERSEKAEKEEQARSEKAEKAAQERNEKIEKEGKERSEKAEKERQEFEARQKKTQDELEWDTQEGEEEYEREMKLIDEEIENTRIRDKVQKAEDRQAAKDAADAWGEADRKRRLGQDRPPPHVLATNCTAVNPSDYETLSDMERLAHETLNPYCCRHAEILLGIALDSDQRSLPERIAAQCKKFTRIVHPNNFSHNSTQQVMATRAFMNLGNACKTLPLCLPSPSGL